MGNNTCFATESPKNSEIFVSFATSWPECRFSVFCTLKSPRAVQTTIAIVEAYAKLKELSRVIVEIPQQQDNKDVQKRLLHRSGQLVEDLMSDVLPKQRSDTTLELNLAMLKFRHTVHREKEE